jgi:hypothetical protein
VGVRFWGAKLIGKLLVWRVFPSKAGRKAVPMDVVLGPNYDLTTDVGFSNALFQVCNLSPGTSHTSAPVCSTFVWMNLVKSRVCKFSFIFVRPLVFFKDSGQV